MMHCFHGKHTYQLALAALSTVVLLGGAFCVVRQQATSVEAKAVPSAQINDLPITDEQYRDASASDLAQMIRDGKVSSQQLIKHASALVQQEDPDLNAVISLREDKALKEASAMKDTGQPFYGVPILIKGLGQQLKGESNTNGLKPLKGKTADKTSDYVKRLQSLGFVIIGQTNYPELGLTNVTKSKLYGDAHNPWDPKYNTGGSSGGGVASLAKSIVPVTTGNDAGGSLRIPASWSGVIGLKPTQGVIVGDDTVPSSVNFANAKNVSDLKKYFDGMINEGNRDELVKEPTQDLKKYPIAYSTKSPVGTKVSKDAIKAVKQTVKFLRAQGYTVVKKNAPVDGKKLMKTYYKESTPSGTSANELIKEKTGKNMKYKDVSPMTWALYQADKKQPKSIEKQIAKENELVDRQMTDFHKKYPLYLTPTTAKTAAKNSDPAYLPKYTKRLHQISKLDHKKQIQLIYDAWMHGLAKTPFTQLANVSGEPALSLPIYVSKKGLPLGVQFEAAKGQDQLLLEIGQLFQDEGQLQFLDDYLADK